MTRVNVVPVEELSGKHLGAEYREIPRVVNYVKKLLEKKNIFDILNNIPDEYCLGEGHVKFFSNKLGYIKKRHELLIKEGLRRGYNYSSICIDLNGLPEKLCKDYIPTSEAMNINRKRIKERS